MMLVQSYQFWSRIRILRKGHLACIGAGNKYQAGPPSVAVIIGQASQGNGDIGMSKFCQ